MLVTRHYELSACCKSGLWDAIIMGIGLYGSDASGWRHKVKRVGEQTDDVCHLFGVKAELRAKQHLLRFMEDLGRNKDGDCTLGTRRGRW
jgi:hypothetical protein